jgi:hypothetical protein
VNDDPRRRNYRIAALGGSLVLPLAGLVAVAMFWIQDDRELAMYALAGALLGAVAWILVLTA